MLIGMSPLRSFYEFDQYKSPSIRLLEMTRVFDRRHRWGNYHGELVFYDDAEYTYLARLLRFVEFNAQGFNRDLFFDDEDIQPKGSWGGNKLTKDESLGITVDGYHVETVLGLKPWGYEHGVMGSRWAMTDVIATCPVSSLDAALELARDREFCICLEVLLIKYSLRPDADLRGADLSFAKLDGLDLSNANLAGASLERASLVGCKLSGANLIDANLSKADLSQVHFGTANLKGANLKHSCLAGAQLSEADLTGAVMPNGRIHE